MVTFIEQYWRFLNKLQLDVIRVDMITETFLALTVLEESDRFAICESDVTGSLCNYVNKSNQMVWSKKKFKKERALFRLHVAHGIS